MSSPACTLTAALNLWLKLSGVDPESRSFTISMGGGMSDYHVSKMHKAIKEALELDDSNVSGIMMLSAVASQYFKERTVTVDALVERPEETMAYIQEAAKLKQLLASPALATPVDAFMGTLRAALTQYGLDSPEVVAMLDDKEAMGQLRRDAFYSMSKLKLNQFLAGQPEAEGFTPRYHNTVHQFWHINALVEEACRQPSGVTLSLVRDPNDLESYFVFAIRNGGNLYTLSDVPTYRHPLQRYMSRRGARLFEERVADHRFPYELLQLVYNPDSKAYYADQMNRRALVPAAQAYDKLKTIDQLEPATIIWLVLLLDLIVDRFWAKPLPALPLSYTGAMIREQNQLLVVAQQSQLPVAPYTGLTLATVTTESLTAENLEGVFDSDGGKVNQWLEERFAGRVPENLLSLVDNPDTKFYLPSLKEHSAGVSSGEQNLLTIQNPNEKFPAPNRYALEVMPSTTFGTEESLEKSRLFLARFNQAKVIQRLADEEFAAREKEVLAWFCKRVNANSDYLLGLAACGTILRDNSNLAAGGSLSPGDNCIFYDNHYRFVHKFDADDRTARSLALRSCLTLRAKGDNNYNRQTCFVTGAQSVAYLVAFMPQTPQDLAELAGCAVSDLPDVLQQWAPARQKRGNSILDNIDPMSWALRDPWCALSLNIRLPLSIRGFAQCAKRFPERVLEGKQNMEKMEQLRAAYQEDVNRCFTTPNE